MLAIKEPEFAESPLAPMGEAVTRVAISADGRWAAAASADHKGRLWDLSVNREPKQALEVQLGERGTAPLESTREPICRVQLDPAALIKSKGSSRCEVT